jgi:hypothetical protein
MFNYGGFVRCGVVAALVAGLSGCGGGGGEAQRAQPVASVSKSTEPPYIPSPIRTVTLEPRPGPTTAETTPAECRYASVGEVEDVIGEPVTGTTVAVGGCWYRLAGVGTVDASVKISVFRDRAAQLDQGEVAVSGLGGKAFWYEGNGNLEVQAGRNVLWVEVGSIKADDKLDRAKKLVAIVRKRV